MQATEVVDKLEWFEIQVLKIAAKYGGQMLRRDLDRAGAKIAEHLCVDGFLRHSDEVEGDGYELTRAGRMVLAHETGS